jgi:hypothetical protein
MHRNRRKRYGHAEAKAVAPHLYKIEEREVVAFVAKHHQHEGLRYGIELLDRWLVDGNAGRKVPAARHARRLFLAGITGKRIVETCAALWLYSDRNPRTLPDDVRLDYAMAVAVLHLAPTRTNWRDENGKYREMRFAVPSATERKELASFLRRTFGPLFGNIAAGIAAEIDLKRRKVNSLYEPFAVEQ